MMSRSSQAMNEQSRHLKFDEEFFIPPKQKVQYLKRLSESAASTQLNSSGNNFAFKTAPRTELPSG